jgi:hypothetical protein
MSKPRKKKIRISASGGAINWALLATALTTALTPAAQLLLAGGVITSGMWVGAGLSIALALLAGNVRTDAEPDASEGNASEGKKPSPTPEPPPVFSDVPADTPKADGDTPGDTKA